MHLVPSSKARQQHFGELANNLSWRRKTTKIETLCYKTKAHD